MIEINYLAVLVAGMVPMVIGAIWYGPIFGKRWLRLMDTSEEEIARDFNPLKTYGVSFLLALATAFGLSVLLDGFSGALHGVHAALVAVIAFVLPVGYQSVAFERRKTGLFALNLGYNLIAIMSQAILLSIWK